MMSTIFSLIVAGEVPCHKVWEDDDHLAFLDIRPFARGHTLVIPKRAHDDLFTLSPRRAQALWSAAHVVARRLREVVPCERVATLVLGYEVPHAHIHLIPTTSESQVLNPSPLPTDHVALASLAEELRGELKGEEPDLSAPALPTTEAVEERWDEFADRFVSQFEPNTLRVARAAIDQLRLGEASQLLEVGCGGGGAAVELRARLDEELKRVGRPLTDATLTATDISSEMVRLAQARVKRRGVEGVQVSRADAQALPFEAGRFDRLLSCLNLMLLPDPVTALSEAARVLQPGGVGAWVVWGRAEHSPMMTLLPQAAKRVGLELPPVARSNFHLGGVDRRRTLLQEAGFERVRLWYQPMPTTVETGEEFAELTLTERPELKGRYASADQERALRQTLSAMAQERLDQGEPIMLDTLIAVARRR